MVKQVILIGDSIRQGYQATVQTLLKDEALIWSPIENGQDSHNVLARLTEWCLERPADVIHLNCGLHDIKRPFDASDQTQNQVPLDEYRQNLIQILTTLQTQTKAKTIFALITPVNHDWHHTEKTFDRFEEDVHAYNQAARAICQDLNIPINDLYTTVLEADRDAILVKDGVHFSTEGYALLGQAVTEIIQAHF